MAADTLIIRATLARRHEYHAGIHLAGTHFRAAGRARGHAGDVLAFDQPAGGSGRRGHPAGDVECVAVTTLSRF